MKRLIQTDNHTYTIVHHDYGAVTEYFAQYMDSVLDSFLNAGRTETYKTMYGDFIVRSTIDGNGDFTIIGRYEYNGHPAALIYHL